MENGVPILHGVSLAKIGFPDAFAVRLVLAKLLHGFFTEIPARIAAHPAGAGSWRIDHLAERFLVPLSSSKIHPPMKTTIAPQTMAMMPAHRAGWSPISIRHDSIPQSAPQPSPDGFQGGRTIAWA